MMQKAFVFVVCGAAEHLNMLKESYAWLAARTNLPIYVVTDSKRNEWHIQYENLIDVPVDPSFNHHQAAIWLKTSLHKILPTDYLFAYLDSDVLSWSNKVDDIFNHYVSPVTFAPDHCKLNQFSSYAVNCGCLATLSSVREMIQKEIIKQDILSLSSDVEIQQKRKVLFDLLAQNKRSFIGKLFFYTRYFLSRTHFQVGPFYFNKKLKIWNDESGTAIMYHVNMSKIAEKLNLRWNVLKQELQLTDGRPVFKDSCTHLPQLIEKKFSITIDNVNWQHWNGGVFVFHTGNNRFMQTWHELTMQIFDDPEWKTRDQGTLVATVWKLGLQNHPTLEREWNLIIDYYTPGIELTGDGIFIMQGKKFRPHFIHVYHHFGDTSWSLWNKIASFKPQHYL